MSFTFRPAVRENVSVLVGMMGGTGSGKTRSAMRLASGMAGNKRFAVIDTEARRALHYASDHAFDYVELKAPFSPQAYLEAIRAAESAGYSVIMVDSMSHEWEGVGGVMDMHDDEVSAVVERRRKFAEQKGWQFDEDKERNAANIAAWVKPKVAHREMMNGLLQVRASLVLCFRAQDKIEIAKDADGKTVIREKQTLTGLNGWVPICEKRLPFELTASLLFTADAPGVPKPIKIGPDARFFPTDRQITEESGRLVAEWASGAPPIDHGKALREASSIAELVEAWTRIPKAQQKALTDVKNARKQELEQAAKSAEVAA